MNRKIKVAISKILYGGRRNIDLGNESYIGIGSKIFGTHVVMDDYNGVENLLVVGSQPVIIGKYCALAGNLTIITSNHIMNKPNIQAKFQNEHFQDSMDDGSKGPIKIGNAVWIGLNVTILPGVTIGDGAIIGAGSVVTKSVDPFVIAVGNPAHTIRKRFKEATIKQLLKDPWWNWDKKKIQKNRSFFITPLK